MVFKINKTSDYSVISNKFLKEKDMSLKAKGLLATMLSLPEDWVFSINGLVAICKEEECAIKNTLDELKKFGYLIVDKKMPNETTSGRIEYVYNIYEEPHQKQEGGFLPLEFLPLENQPLLNTNNKVLNINKENFIKESCEIRNENQVTTSIVASNDKPSSRQKQQKGTVTHTSSNTNMFIANNEQSDIQQKVGIGTETSDVEETNTIVETKEKRFIKPTVEQVINYCKEQGYVLDAQYFIDYYESKGWCVGKSKMKDWKAAVRTWMRNRNGKPNNQQKPFTDGSGYKIL